MLSKEPFKLEQISSQEIQSPLLAFRKNVASQDGEDGIIEKIFQIVKPTNRFCVEFGAWDGKLFSNTWNLIDRENWRGVLIEGNAGKFTDLLSTYSENPDIVCLNRFVEFDGPNALDVILDEVEAPSDLDLLSIDVDGPDYFIWESLVKYQPRVIVIEFNPTIPNDVIFVQAKANEINQGCSLLALTILGKNKGYELVCCTGWNAFFVKAELYDQFELKSNQIHVMYKPISDGRIFHGYDSRIFVTGMPKLLWSDIALDAEDFQVLPAAARKFGDSQR
jgi:hypothetical protein